MCVLPLPVSPSPLLTSHLFCVARWNMSITDVLSADDIAAALQECQGEGGLEEQGVVALWGPEQENKFSGAWTTSDSSSQNKHTGLGCPPGVYRDLGSIPAYTPAFLTLGKWSRRIRSSRSFLATQPGLHESLSQKQSNKQKP